MYLFKLTGFRARFPLMMLLHLIVYHLIVASEVYGDNDNVLRVERTVREVSRKGSITVKSCGRQVWMILKCCCWWSVLQGTGVSREQWSNRTGFHIPFSYDYCCGSAHDGSQHLIEVISTIGGVDKVAHQVDWKSLFSALELSCLANNMTGSRHYRAVGTIIILSCRVKLNAVYSIGVAHRLLHICNMIDGSL